MFQSLARPSSSELQTQRAKFCYISTFNMEIQNQHVQNNYLLHASLSPSSSFCHVSQHREWQNHYPNQKPGAMLIHPTSHNLQYITDYQSLQFHLLNTFKPLLHLSLPCLECWEAKLVQA